MKRIFLLSILLMVIVFPAAVRAEVIYLKNGKVIKGKITKETGYSVQVMQKGFPKNYYLEQIDRIEPDEVPIEPEQEQKNAEKYYIMAGQAEPLTAEKRELVSRLLEANGGRESIVKVFDQIINQAPDGSKEMYEELFNVDDVLYRIIPIYAKYYTQDDLQQLITFYKTPLGEKHINATPLLVQETMNEMIKYFQEKMPKEEAPSPAPAQ